MIGEQERESNDSPQLIREVNYQPDIYRGDPPQPGSWFDVNRFVLTETFIQRVLVPDIWPAKLHAEKIILEASMPYEFYFQNTHRNAQGEILVADEEARLRTLAHLSHLATFFGLFTIEEIEAINARGFEADQGLFLLDEEARAIKRGEPGHREFQEVMLERLALKRSLTPDLESYRPIVDMKAHTLEAAVLEIERLLHENPNAIIGVVQGSLDPVHVFHSAYLLECWSYCDFFLVVIDNDLYIQRVKGAIRDPNRRANSEQERVQMLYAVRSGWDGVAVSDIDLPSDNAFIDLYKRVHASRVFVHPTDPLIDRRRGQIEAAGAEMFTHTGLEEIGFSSTEWWRLHLEERFG